MCYVHVCVCVCVYVCRIHTYTHAYTHAYWHTIAEAVSAHDASAEAQDSEFILIVDLYLGLPTCRELSSFDLGISRIQFFLLLVMR